MSKPMDLQFALDWADDWRSRDRSRASDAHGEAMVVLADEIIRLRADLAVRTGQLHASRDFVTSLRARVDELESL